VVPPLLVAVVEAEADVAVTVEPVVLVTVDSPSFVTGDGEEKMQAAVKPAAVNASTELATADTSILMCKPWRE